MLCSRPRPLNAIAPVPGLPNAQRERPSRVAGSCFVRVVPELTLAACPTPEVHDLNAAAAASPPNADVSPAGPKDRSWPSADRQVPDGLVG